MNDQDPGHSPALSTTGDPHHHRAPSLGEMHQELEQEQEAQVNRLLQMIRSQQTQLQQLQQQQQPAQQASSTGTAVVDETNSTPQPELGATPFPLIPPLPAPRSRTSTLSSHRPSRRSSQADNHHALASTHPEGGNGGAAAELGPRRSSRDETAFYQAEAAMLNRENQMLRQRIRDLVANSGRNCPERQLSESHETANT